MVNGNRISLLSIDRPFNVSRKARNQEGLVPNPRSRFGFISLSVGRDDAGEVGSLRELHQIEEDDISDGALLEGPGLV